jgi:hypothetical protein
MPDFFLAGQQLGGEESEGGFAGATMSGSSVLFKTWAAQARSSSASEGQAFIIVPVAGETIRYHIAD